MKNVITGAVVETSFNPTAKFEEAFVERRSMEYSYNDGNLYYFMDPETYELEPIDESMLSDSFRFVKENMICTVSSYKGQGVRVDPPTFVELTITETDPASCNTATNATKPAKLETGAEIKVPLFLEEGERIKIDTRTGEYLSAPRAEKSCNNVQPSTKGGFLMTTSEKVAYLKGSCRRHGHSGGRRPGKLFHVIIDILEDLSLDLADTKDALVDLTDGVEEINEDLAELENEFYESPCSCCGGDDEDEEYDDEDEDDTVFYSVECPGCGFKLTVDEDYARRGLL